MFIPKPGIWTMQALIRYTIQEEKLHIDTSLRANGLEAISAKWYGVIYLQNKLSLRF
jgi:hypothetical protein